MRSYTLFDEKNVTTDWVSEKLADGNCSTSFGSMGKYWAFYSDGRLWEATLFENSRHELRLVNRDYRMKCDIVCMMDRLQRLSDSLDELRLEVGWDGKDTLIVRPYYTREPFILFEALEKARAKGWDYCARIPGHRDIMYCGAGLTAAGRCRFKDALSLPAKILDDGYTIEVGLESSPKPCLDLAVEMFEEMNRFNPSKEGVLFFLGQISKKLVMERERTKEAALAFIENGGHCIKRFGWAWKGGRTEPCSKEEALRLLQKFDFGKGYYELVWRDRSQTLEFCELSEADML